VARSENPNLVGRREDKRHRKSKYAERGGNSNSASVPCTKPQQTPVATATLTTIDTNPNRLSRRVLTQTSNWVGGGLVLLFVVIALLADFISPYPIAAPGGQVAAAPSPAHLLGTDALGKDVLTRVIHGSRLSLVAGAVSILLAVLIGCPWGALAGYFGGRADAFLMRSVDVALAFPSILIALLLAAAWRPSWFTVIVAVGLINVPTFARQVRATVLTVTQLEYVTASRALGATTPHILRRAILPALISPIVILATLSVGTAILEVAGLAFLGLGGDPTAAEWGSMLSQAKDYWSSNLWFAVAPGVAISLTVLGFNLLGDGLRDALDPRSDLSNL
jgi:peptide/nickel transport system permease protein